MFQPSIAQPRVIQQVKTILEDIGLNPEATESINDSVKSALALIEDHQAKPERFRQAIDNAIERLKATPVETLMALAPVQHEVSDEPTLEVRERLYFARTMGQMDSVTPELADAFIESHQETWRAWQESRKFWEIESY
ncbi:hypothetical protein [Pseudomonas putida]|uniref:Uncharacterized protein n=1 Tax=Pseudomonas putida TaxID=303 RepID=A0A8I1E9U7_PSEPU|nr:hypothetical protein [Pseudomonas putida]MBI6882465.1 hypothetical protein [Pseudomonas putida]